MRKKKQQRLVYVPNQTQINRPAQWKPISYKRPRGASVEAEPSSAPTKRQKMEEDTEKKLMNSLEITLRYRIKKEIKQAILDKKDIAQLQKDIENRQVLPRGTFTAAEQHAGVKASTLDKLMKRKKVKPIDYYQQFVRREFKALHLSASKETSEQEDTASVSSGESLPISLTSEDTEDIENDEREIRTVSYPIESLLRSDLAEDIRRAFLDTLEINLQNTSDYIIAYSIQILKIISLFKNSTFAKRADSTIGLTPGVGSPVDSILPRDFIVSSKDITDFPPTLDLSLLNDASFKKDFENLFSSSHFNLLHTDYFGTGSTRRKGLLPCVDAIKTAFPHQEKRSEVGEPFVMRLALSQYMTNFENMWSNSKRQYRLLNHVLIVLLRIHLAPDRERSRREYIDKKKAEKGEKDARLAESNAQHKHPGIANRSYNAHRRLFHNERSKLEKYELKAASTNDPWVQQKWVNRALASEIRLETYDKVLIDERAKNTKVTTDAADEEETIAEDILADTNPNVAAQIHENENDTPNASKDLTRRRLLILRAIIRKIIFECRNSELDFSPQQLKVELPNMSDQEVEVCSAICNFMLPYVPSRENAFKIAHQLPFFLMSNDLLRITGYAKFSVSIAPLPGLNSLQSMQINSPALFSLFCISRTSRNMKLYDLDNTIIENRAESIESKDGVFSSFFDIQKLHKLCSDHGLDFAHNAYVVPGMKVLRINGHKKNALPPNSVSAAKDKGKGRADLSLSERKATASSSKGKATISKSKGKEKADVSGTTKQGDDKKAAIRTSIDKLEADLRELNEKEKAYLTSNSVGSLKKHWIKKVGSAALSLDSEVYNAVLYQEIIKAKRTRDKINRKVSNTKQQLQNARRDLHKLNSTNASADESPKSKHLITNQNYIGMEDVENLKIQEDLLRSKNVTFSGTDNGLVTMTESVPLSLDRFIFHISLYNRFSTLQEESSSITETSSNFSFLELPPSHKVTAEEVHHGTGALKMQKKLERAKKLERQATRGAMMENENLNILDIEGVMRHHSIKEATGVDDIERRYQEQTKHRQHYRRFYYSKGRANQQYAYELQKARFIDRLCSRERGVLGKNKMNSLVMFIGDRGEGTGSRIKGFLRYGGKWKPKVHSRYSTVCITNEYNTSQTCVFCFQKLLHPKKLITKKDISKFVKSVNGSFHCVNHLCPLVVNARAIQERDRVSALAIAVSGLSSLVLGETVPPFNCKFSDNTDTFNHLAASFLNKKQNQAHERSS